MTRHAFWGVALLFVLFATGCNKTWVEDEGNFKRAFGFDKPANVQLVHSYYREHTNLFGTTYKYYFVAFRDEKFQFSEFDEMKAAAPDSGARFGCDPNPPGWFVSKSPEHYEMWVFKTHSGIRTFRNKDDNTIYSCAGRGGS